MPRGGRRPGAGAPKGNLKARKSGRHSKQVKALKLALRTVPRTASLLTTLEEAGDRKRALFARALHHIAELIVAEPELLQGLSGEAAGAIQSLDPADLGIDQIRELLKNSEFNQSIKEVGT